MRILTLTLSALFLLSCANRDTFDMPADYDNPTAKYNEAVPRGERKPTKRDFKRGVHDGKFDAHNGYRYAIRGGNQGNQAYIDGYAAGYRSLSE